jgi:hypothetical protein
MEIELLNLFLNALPVVFLFVLFSSNFAEVADVVEVDELSDTARGVGGFGSTGVAKKTTPAPAASEEDQPPLKKQKVDENAPEAGAAAMEDVN